MQTQKNLRTGLAILAAITFSLHSCAPSKNGKINDQAVSPPLKDVDVPDQEYTINASENDTLVTTSGTTMTIPKGTLVDENGKAVAGNVSFSYREFHTAAEIIASGITMQYDSAGQVYPFESAGMFELTASQNGKPVFVREGGSIALSFISYKSGDFNFYELDTVANNWVYKTSGGADTNVVFKQISAALAALGTRPAEPQAVDPNLPMINFDIDPELRPELANYNNVLWQYAGTGNDPEKDGRVYNTSWTRMSLEPNADEQTYTLNLAAANESFTTQVRPVLSDADLKTARQTFREKLKVWEAKRQERETQLGSIPPFTRQVSVSRFGFANCDRIFGRPDAIVVIPDFDFGSSSFNDHREEVTLYLIADGNAIPASAHSGYSFRFSPSMKNGFVAIRNKTNEVCVMTRDDFAKVSAKNNASARFSFTPHPMLAKTVGDLNTIINSL
ncbi:MAG: hypothetical protein ACRCYO_13870 [Bacteroidia bacterium]